MTIQNKKNSRGFTIVEILIVIAVIGILLSISLVVYPGYQQSARDTERKSDVEQIAAALRTYAIQNNDFVGDNSGCGANSDGNGWFNATGSVSGVSYPRSIAACLQDKGVLKASDFVDPSGCVSASGGVCGTTTAQAYMKATCSKAGVPITYVFAHLESQPPKNGEVDGLCDDGTVLGFVAATQKWGSLYGMNYYVGVK